MQGACGTQAARGPGCALALGLAVALTCRRSWCGTRRRASCGPLRAPHAPRQQRSPREQHSRSEQRGWPAVPCSHSPRVRSTPHASRIFENRVKMPCPLPSLYVSFICIRHQCHGEGKRQPVTDADELWSPERKQELNRVGVLRQCHPANQTVLPMTCTPPPGNPSGGAGAGPSCWEGGLSAERQRGRRGCVQRSKTEDGAAARRICLGP
eukprot:1478762-Rhodomonas_salina.4